MFSSSLMKWCVAITVAIMAVIFQSDLFVILCFQLWLLDDILSHYLAIKNDALFRLKNVAFDSYEHYYSPFDRGALTNAMQMTTIRAQQYETYAQLKQITNGFQKPTVIRGLMKHSMAMSWNYSYLNDAIGDEVCEVLLPDSRYFEMEREHKLYSDILANVTGNGWNYVSGDQNVLFNGSNHLIRDLQLAEILGHDYIKSDDFLEEELYLFIGNQNGGTSWHSAPNRSVFVLLKGVKQWIFIDPKYAVYLKPQRSQLYSRILLLFGKFIRNSKSANHFQNAGDLYRHIPHYKVLLHAGDAITVPSWWWHHVSNVDDGSGDALNIGIDIDTKSWNHDYLRSIFPRWF